MRPSHTLTRARWRLLLAAVLFGAVWLQAASGAPVGAQVPTPTPFRFLTPTPFVPRTTTTVTTTTAPRAGSLPMELALPALAGGLAAVGGGAYLLRRTRERRQ
ncbi:MAG: hypothetical protein M3336_10130 [Chloroflexota bacterium]|nr:hypothetical protein [Chloroflexota bacterium]